MKIWAIVCVFILLGSVTFNVSFAADAPKAPILNQNDRYKNLELFQRVLQFVEKNYVDDVRNDALIHGAIKGMLETLDPHSNFLTSEVYRDMKIETSGKFGGVGVEVGIKDEVLTVISPMEDSPAWRAGIQPADKIVKINGESTKGFTMTEAVASRPAPPSASGMVTPMRPRSPSLRSRPMLNLPCSSCSSACGST